MTLLLGMDVASCTTTPVACLLVRTVLFPAVVAAVLVDVRLLEVEVVVAAELFEVLLLPVPVFVAVVVVVVLLLLLLVLVFAFSVLLFSSSSVSSVSSSSASFLFFCFCSKKLLVAGHLSSQAKQKGVLLSKQMLGFQFWMNMEFAPLSVALCCCCCSCCWAEQSLGHALELEEGRPPVEKFAVHWGDSCLSEV